MGKKAHPRSILLSKKGYARLWPIMSAEERHARNGDKRVPMGFSSSGIPLPSHEDLVADYKAKEIKRKEYKKNHPEKKHPSKMFINVSMGGHNKMY